MAEPRRLLGLLALGFGLFAASCTEKKTVHINGESEPPANTDSTDGADTATPDDGPATADEGAPPAPTFAVPCPAGLAAFVESEDNDHWSKSNALGTNASPGFCVQGAALCGNDGKDGYENGGDHFSFQIDGDATVAAELTWAPTADFDLLMSPDFEGGDYVVSFKSGVGVAEKETVELKGGVTYYISINCWAGTSGDYALTVRW